MGLRQRWSQIVLACVMIGFLLISGAEPGLAALQPGESPTQARAIADHETRQISVPDWLQITFASLPTMEGDGGFDGSAWVEQLGYDISRTWEDGMSPDQVLQLGDIRELEPELFSLQGIERIIQSPLGNVSLANFPLIGEQTLQSMSQAVPGLSERLISETPPIQALLDTQGMGDLANHTLADVLDQRPQLADSRLDQIDLSAFSVSSIPGLMETPLAQLENWQGSLIREIPGLNQVPLGRFPNPLGTAGGISMRIDMVYGPAEVSRDHTISGSYEQGFAVPCAQSNQDCAYIELDDLENKGRGARGQPEGLQWISGKYQDVKGGHGVLGALNGGREPTGRHPFGSAFKVVVWEPDETTDTVSTALFFRVCGKFVGCSPYFIGPLPFFSYQRDDMIFVGLLDGGVGSTGPPSRPTGAQPGGGFPSFSGFPDLGGLGVSGFDDPCFTLNPQGVDLETLTSAIASLQSSDSDYRTVGTYTCADGEGRCGRSLGRYQLMSDQPEVVQQIQRVEGGEEFLDRVNRGHRPSEAEMRQFFPPEAQDWAFQNALADLAQQAAGQIDPTTGSPFKGRRLIERATQMYFGGPDSIIDGDSADVYGHLSLKQSGESIAALYEAGGGVTGVCLSSDGGAEDPALGKAPPPGQINAAIHQSMQEMGRFDTRAGPDGGNLACAWSVNRILANAGIEPIGENPNYVPSVEADLRSGRGRAVNRAEAQAGDIVIAGHQHHIGVCLNQGCSRVRSNSSSRARFTWDSDTDFNGTYGGKPSRIYRIVS